MKGGSLRTTCSQEPQEPGLSIPLFAKPGTCSCSESDLVPGMLHPSQPTSGAKSPSLCRGRIPNPEACCCDQDHCNCVKCLPSHPLLPDPCQMPHKSCRRGTVPQAFLFLRAPLHSFSPRRWTRSSYQNYHFPSCQCGSKK